MRSRRGPRRRVPEPRSRVAARLFALLALATVLLAWEGLGLAGEARFAAPEAAGCSIDAGVAPRPQERRRDDVRASDGGADEKALAASWWTEPTRILTPRAQHRADGRPAGPGVIELSSSALGPSATASLLHAADGARVADLLERVLDRRGVRDANPARGPPARRSVSIH